MLAAIPLREDEELSIEPTEEQVLADEMIESNEIEEADVGEVEGVVATTAADMSDTNETLSEEFEREASAVDDKPAASDIKALLERVEALAAKAGAINIDDLPEPTSNSVEDEIEKPREAGAAA